MKNNHIIKSVKLFMFFTVFLFALHSNAFCQVQDPSLHKIKGVRAKVTDAVSKEKDHQIVDLIILKENYLDKKYRTDFYSTANFYGITLRKGDEVFVTLTIDKNRNIKEIIITNVARDKYMIYLFAGFILLLFAIGGFKGLRAVISLIISCFAIIKLLLPLIIRGYDPIYVTVVTCSVVTVLTLVIIGGFNMKTVSAILGTLCGLGVAAVLAIKIGDLSHITGVVDDEFYLLQFLPLKSSFSYQGLLFAGIIIGSLGAVMDVSMSIASAINELMEHSYNMNAFKLIAAGMNVGKDAIGTMTNTLILAYAGGSIDMMIVLVAENTSLSQLINREVIASEILRSMAGSIGLLITVPVTAVIAGFLMCRHS